MPTDIAWIDVPGGRLHAVVDGDGPPIVLVHAGIVDLRSWDALVPYLVVAGFRVIRYDTRGFGASTTADVAFSDRADLRAVLDHFGVARAVLVGNSRGAMICLDAVLESPERIAALAWIGGGIDGYESDPSAEEESLFARLEAAEEALDGTLVAELDLQVWVDGVGQPATRVSPKIRAAVREMDLPLYDPDRITGRPIPPDRLANDHLHEIGVPVLAVVGTLDTSQTRSAARRLADAVPGAVLVEIPEVAHMVGMETPQRLADVLAGFIATIDRWG